MGALNVSGRGLAPPCDARSMLHGEGIHAPPVQRVRRRPFRSGVRHRVRGFGRVGPRLPRGGSFLAPSSRDSPGATG
eukprot:CAMPEP_0168194558 /NCGR_PEP_ID=MMETSP0139_2-20121125/19296_1 /TAXON_ID=44445 /ORGANISM="Pseudo-nitzschia australis, Strain 10249 10 AB" /LENGTH=76 /DNA_ID=CAMNT_0008118173 /DNA_START=782 /DNA_END=1008 /DNA_ORIENTATION=-